MTTFLAISTGQNVANVVPILEAWEAGSRVLWLESTHARRQGWSEGALEVLRARGITNLRRVPFDEHPDSVLQATASALATVRGDDPVVWVGNGGTKPQALAVAQALAGWKGRWCLVYNAQRPAGCEMFPEGLAGRRVFVPYRKTALRLEELLSLSGHALFAGRGPARIWPDGEPVDSPDDGYGTDPEATFREYEQRYLRWKRGRQGGRAEIRLPPVEELRRRDPAGFAEWWEKMEAQLRGVCRKVAAGKARPQHIDPMLNHVIRYVRQAWGQQEKALWAEQAGIPEELGGRRFEQAVARRLRTWLEGAGQAPLRDSLCGVWANVRVARKQQPEKVVQEFDLTLLLRNGVLLAIECKAGQVQEKDLDARLLNMQASTSLESAMAVVVPAFTGYAGRAGDAEMVRRWKRLCGLPRLRALPFTLPGQPPGWKDPDTGERLTVPSFEQALTDWLRPYLR